MKNPVVSVVVPTFNSGKTLETCLRSIQNQRYKDTELIIVDAFSKDNTRQVAGKFMDSILLLAAERSPARNLGARQARGRYVFFIDSDMELTPNVIEECVALSVFRSADAVIVPEESVGQSYVAKCKRLEKAMRMGEAYGEAARFFKKRAFEFVGGYNENLVIGEDFELTQRLREVGFTIGRCSSTIRHHEGHVSVRKLAAKLYYYGKTLPNYVSNEPSLALKTSSPIRFARNMRLLRREPAYFVGLCLLKLIEYGAYLAGAFSYVLSKKP
jgi:glycosyltransferase involved in cell wall biosynthesis